MTVAGVELPRFAASFLAAEERRELRVGRHTRIRLDLHWQRQDAPVAVLVHGLGSDSRAPYVVGAAHKAWRTGFSVLRINLRGCGGTEAWSPGLYHAALSEDLEAAVDWVLRERRPPFIGLAGFSLGGSLVLHAAARWGDAPPAELHRLWVQAAPFDLEATSEALHRGGFSRVYVNYFMSAFRRSWRRRHRAFPDRYPRDGLRGIHSVRAFDERWTAPSFGWSDARSYYREASAIRVLDRVRIPGTVLHSRDDPFVPLTSAAEERLRAHPTLDLWVTEKGGHNAFYARRPAACSQWRDLDRWWGENRMVQDFARASGLRCAGFRSGAQGKK